MNRKESLVALTPMCVAGLGLNIISQAIWWLDGPVDAAVLEQAAGDIHRRHEALHSRYVVSGPAAGHAIVPADPGRPLFRVLPDALTDAAAVDVMRELLPPPLRIEDGEVWRWLLIRSAESGRSLLAIGVDHTAFDAKSAGIVAGDLSVAYAARLAGQAPVFASRVASMAEIAAEHHEQLASVDLDAQRDYWRDEFRGVQHCYLPDRSPAVRPRGIGPVAEPVVTFSPAQLAAWRAYGRAHGMTDFAWLCAVFIYALVEAGAPEDTGLMFGIGNRGSELIDRSVTCRVVMAFLRPNGPARQGGNLLVRTHEAFNQAMANMEGRLSPADVPAAVGLSPAEFPVLQALPHVVDVERSGLTITLGNVVGTPAAEFSTWHTAPADISIQPTHSTGDKEVRIKIAIRTDAYPASLPERICELVTQVIADGPDRLEQQTSAARLAR